MEIVKFPKRTAPVEITGLLKELLSEAEAGHITAIAFTIIDGKNVSNTGWGYDKGIDPCQLIGGSVVLTHRLVRDLDSDL